METDGEPDVYVKTVLMFSEKLAPAMAQIAVRKTGDLDKVLESEGFAVNKGWTLKKVLTNIESQERGFLPRRS